MANKHRLIFLGTLLIGLILFYFGVNTWMEQKSKETTPPPPIVIKQTKPEPKPKPEEKTKPQEKQEEVPKVEKEVIKAKEAQQKAQKPKPQEMKVAEKKEKKEEKRVEKETIKKEEKKPVKKEKKEKKMPPKKTTAKKLKTYVFQVGAYKEKKNALKAVKLAKKKGYTAKIVKKGDYYKVYVYVRASSYKNAYRSIKKYFSDAFPVRR